MVGKDYTGLKIGRLTFIRKTDKRSGHSFMWELLCECGNLHYAPPFSLTRGKTKSCGCLSKERSEHSNEKTQEAIIKKFWSHVDKTKFCWNWTGRLSDTKSIGIPLVTFGGKNTFSISARRLSLQLVGKEPPDKNRIEPLVCHNQLCVNPDHLVAGDEARFWVKVHKLNEPNGCWVWTGCHSREMYGKFGLYKTGGKINIMAHAYSWQLFSGRPVPKGLLVCHKCDHPYCVNPDHLFLGSNQDNMDDKVQKNRQTKHALTEEQVKQIKADGKCASYPVLASRYEVSATTIRSILLELTWKHVT